MQCSGDRFIYGRGQGYMPGVLFSLSPQDREVISEKGSYKQEVFSSLFNRQVPAKVRIGSFLPDIGEDNGSRSATLQKTNHLREENIPVQPTIVLDMPDVGNDFYSHSLALNHKRLAIVLDKTCYLVEDITNKVAGARVVRELYSCGGSFGLRCIEWLNPTTLLVGVDCSFDIFVIDTANLQSVKVHRGVVGSHIDRLSRIARLTNTAFLTGYSCGQVVYNDAITKESRIVVRGSFSKNIVCSIVPTHDAQKVAVGYDKGYVDIYSITINKTFELIRSYRSCGQAAKRAFAWLPGSTTQFISGGGKVDPVLRLYSISNADPFSSYTLPDAISNVIFFDKRQFIAAHGGSIGYFYLDDSKIVFVKDVVAAPDDCRILDAVYNQQAGLVTSSSAEVLKVWDLIVSEKPATQHKSGLLPSLLSIR